MPNQSKKIKTLKVRQSIVIDEFTLGELLSIIPTIDVKKHKGLYDIIKYTETKKQNYA